MQQNVGREVVYCQNFTGGLHNLDLRAENRSMDMSDLPKYIREQRQKAALTQQEAVELLGYRKSQFLSSLERGLTKPPVDVLKKMCEVYRVPREEMRQRYIQAQVEEARKKAEAKWPPNEEKPETPSH